MFQPPRDEFQAPRDEFQPLREEFQPPRCLEAGNADFLFLLVEADDVLCARPISASRRSLALVASFLMHSSYFPAKRSEPIIGSVARVSLMVVVGHLISSRTSDRMAEVDFVATREN